MWYFKANLISGKRILRCPNCRNLQSDQAYYSLDPKLCDSCKTELVFIKTARFLYIIDLKKSSGLFKQVYGYIFSKTEKQAFEEFFEFLNLFKEEKTSK